MTSPTPIAAALASVRGRITQACERSGRDPRSVELVAVSKTHPASAVLAAYEAGQRVFGENYAQELVEKATELARLPDLAWHFIGPLQRNKARRVLERASLLHTLDRPELARDVARLSGELGRRVPVLLEVNVGDEASKAGCALAEAPSLFDEAVRLGLDVRGLMAIPPVTSDPEAARGSFRALASLGRSLFGGAPCVLSMGMSHDLEVAVEEGATLVRVGTALFGARPPKAS